MATNNNETNINYGLLKKIAGRIQSGNDALYRTTYYADPQNKKELNQLKTNIDTSIKNIMDTNITNNGEPNISRLYERMFMKAQNDPNKIKDFEEIFGDNEFISNLTNSYFDNRWVKAQDEEIDDILRYMPKLQEALDTLKDNVLSADSFSKDFLNLSKELKDLDTKFDSNIDELKKNYNLIELSNDIYSDESKYGEVFIYCVPYQTAIQKLMDNNANSKTISMKTNLSEGTVILEDTRNYSSNNIKLEGFDDLSREDNINLNIEIHSGVIESIVRTEKDARIKLQEASSMSLTEQFFNEANSYDINNSGKPNTFTHVTDMDLDEPSKLPKHHNFDKTLHDDLQLPDDEDTTSDGLIDRDLQKSKKIKTMYGCIVKKLERERVVPIILNDICLGYYYFEFDEMANIFEDRYTSTGMTNTITGLRSNGRSEAFDAAQRRDELLSYLAAELANRIDTKFIDNNQELKKEIYHILKYNDKHNNLTNGSGVKMTYIPPEDIHHMYFKLDKNTKRGVSDLALSLIPAKLWVAIYITNCLAVMTRGNDKRVYYVKQSVESNISKTLLKTINEIKKSNFGVRQLESINNVLNITGRFNDYIIPRGADGSSPIDFEVMQGQQVDIKTDLLNLLEESAINPTGVPLDIIQLRQSPDFAIQLTMQNAKFLRFVYSRQSQFQQQLSRLYTKIYNIEYGQNESIELTLPPPLFINITNTNQLITNTSDYCDNIVNIMLASEQDDVLKAVFAKKLKIYHLGSYLNMNVIESLLDESRHEIERKKVVAGEEEQY